MNDKKVQKPKSPKAAKRTRKKTPAKDSQRDENGRFLPGNSIALKWTEDKACQMGEQLLEWMNEAPQNFWIKDFLLEKELYADVIGYLSNKYPPFLEYIARAREIEASRIQKLGLMGHLNSGMAQWILAVNHKIFNIQKSETEIKSTQPIIVRVDDDDIRG